MFILGIMMVNEVIPTTKFQYKLENVHVYAYIRYLKARDIDHVFDICQDIERLKFYRFSLLLLNN